MAEITTNITAGYIASMLTPRSVVTIHESGLARIFNERGVYGITDEWQFETRGCYVDIRLLQKEQSMSEETMNIEVTGKVEAEHVTSALGNGWRVNGSLHTDPDKVRSIICEALGLPDGRLEEVIKVKKQIRRTKAEIEEQGRKWILGEKARTAKWPDPSDVAKAIDVRQNRAQEILDKVQGEQVEP